MISAQKNQTPLDDHDEVALLIGDATRLMRNAFERRITQAGLGLTLGEARALLNIANAAGSRQMDIAIRMGVEPMTLCTYLDKLQHLGLIERQPCSADRRAKRITLAPASADMLDAIRREMKFVIEQGTDGMDADARRKFKHALAAFTANLQSAPSSNPETSDCDEG
jgi:MarR family transcriptional regulator, transcriptional regulator for hemolysin